MTKLRYILLALTIPFLLLACNKMRSGESDSVDDNNVIDSSNVLSEEEKEMQKISALSTPYEIENYMKQSGNWQSYSQGILPIMAHENPDYCKRLLKNKFDYFIVVDKSRMKVILFDRYGVEKKIYGMACAKKYGAKHKRGDNRTAEGFFSVEGIYDSTEWLFTDDDGRTSDIKGQFGPRFIRVDVPFTRSIGIHGTCAPWSIGGRSSHGCIRLTNENILDLVEYAAKGMPLIISPGPKDMDVNEKEGYDIPSITTSFSHPRARTTESHVGYQQSYSKNTTDSVGSSYGQEDELPIEPTTEPVNTPQNNQSAEQI